MPHGVAPLSPHNTSTQLLQQQAIALHPQDLTTMTTFSPRCVRLQGLTPPNLTSLLSSAWLVVHDLPKSHPILLCSCHPLVTRYNSLNLCMRFWGMSSQWANTLCIFSNSSHLHLLFLLISLHSHLLHTLHFLSPSIDCAF